MILISMLKAVPHEAMVSRDRETALHVPVPLLHHNVCDIVVDCERRRALNQDDRRNITERIPLQVMEQNLLCRSLVSRKSLRSFGHIDILHSGGRISRNIKDFAVCRAYDRVIEPSALLSA